MLAILTRMTLTQVSTWFANARRRLKKESKVTWPNDMDDDDEDINVDEDGDVLDDDEDTDDVCVIDNHVGGPLDGHIKPSDAPLEGDNKGTHASYYSIPKKPFDASLTSAQHSWHNAPCLTRT